MSLISFVVQCVIYDGIVGLLLFTLILYNIGFVVVYQVHVS